MRAIAAVTAAAIAGGTLTIAYIAVEVTAATVSVSIPDGIRTLAATIIGLTILGPIGLAILCRQGRILESLEIIHEFMATSDQAQAVRDYNAIRRQLGGEQGGSVTHIHPKE